VNGITWLGHSSVVVEVDGLRLAADPVLRRRVMHLTRETPVPRGALGRIDAVFVSHVHLDHLDVGSLRLFDRTLPVVVPRGAGGILRRQGFRQVLEVAAGDTVVLQDVPVDITPAEHGTVRRWLRARSAAIGFVIRGSHAVYFAGDTDLFEGMRDLRPLDAALLPVAGWGSRLPPGHLDPVRAAEALALLEPRIAVPIHWGTYAPFLSPRPEADPAEAFRAAAVALAPSVQVSVLRQGETLSLGPSSDLDDAQTEAGCLAREP
jgi:L-ascorbate metabolism protein UlaG (beta-lactamase superfamily)